MKSTNSYSKFLAGMGCALALAGCDSIKDVPEEPYAALPAETMVVGGTIVGIGSLRGVTLVNNLDNDTGRSFLANVPVIPNAGPAEIAFSMGAFPVGSHYSITVKNPQPFGKTCVVANGDGTVTLGVPVNNIVVTCNNIVTAALRKSMTVRLPTLASSFSALPGARVRVTTEDQVYEQTVTSGQAQVVFPQILLNATGQANGAPWTVTAVTLEGGRINKCAVSTPSNSTQVFNPVTFLFDTVFTNPTADVATPIVGTPVAGAPGPAPACNFPVTGRVGYSQPPGTAYVSTPITGLVLQLQDPVKNVLETLPVASCSPTTAQVIAGTTTTVPAAVPNAATPVNGCSYTFTTPIRSQTTGGLYVVVVSQQPTGQRCLVTNAGTVNVFTTGTTSPVAVTSANVFCRATPIANKQLHGIFRLQSSIWTPNINTPVPVTSTWQPFNPSVQNNASSNMLGLFSDGTFLYGAHANATQVEHGFYDYDASVPANRKLTFTLITDTNTSMVFPTNFAPTLGVGPASTFTTTPGLSATPNPVRQDFPSSLLMSAYSSHYVMSGVTFGTADSGLGTVRTISGLFGAEANGTVSALRTASPCSTTAPCVDINGTTITATINACTVTVPCVTVNTATGATTDFTAGTSTTCTTTVPCVLKANLNRLGWVLQDPPSINNEMTGSWMQEDRRRIWVWDYRTYYGTAVGVLGGSPSMNDACFTIEDLHAHSGIITRRGSGLGCYAWNRSRTTPAQTYTFTGAEAVDFTVGAVTSLPGYNGRIPGGEPALNPFPVSPILFHVAPAATFFDSADPVYFPENFPAPSSPATSLAWCTTEVLGIRETTNNIPVKDPIYMCRTIAP